MMAGSSSSSSVGGGGGGGAVGGGATTGAAGGAEAFREHVQSRVLQMIGGDTNQKKRWVLRATSREPGAPKAKHVRALILDAWSTGSTDIFWTCLDKRPLATHQVVALKAVVVCLKLLQQGPPEVVAQSFRHLPVVEGIAH
eukprot:g3891.t1